MQTRKKFLLVLAAFVVVAALFGGGAGVHVAQERRQNEARFAAELHQLETLAAAEPFAGDRFVSVLERTVCTGDWAKAERAAKACLRDVYNCFTQMQSVRAYYDFFWLITGDNIVEDGPAFTASFAQIDTATACADEILLRTETLLRPETVQSYLAGTAVNRACEAQFAAAFVQPLQAQRSAILAKMQAQCDLLLRQAAACRVILTYYRDHRADWFVEDRSIFMREDAVAGFAALAPYRQQIYNDPPGPRTVDPRP